MKVTIAVCTRNRADSLRQMLKSLALVPVPPGVSCELLVVDNGSTDDTARVVGEAVLPHMTARLVSEPRRGVAHARNTSITQSDGDILLCVDDDVRLPPRWIEDMIAPIREGRAHVVAGGVESAPHLLRPWMTPYHRMCLAETSHLDPDSPPSIVGANMAIAREVFEKVPAYDPELGPGQLGLAEETLLAEQIKRAGFRIGGALHVAVEHHFDASRLQRQSLLDRARSDGESFAYIHYHFQHMNYRLPRARWFLAWLHLHLWRVFNHRQCRAPEGLSEREMRLVHDLSHWKGFLQQKKRPRNYSNHGLIKQI